MVVLVLVSLSTILVLSDGDLSYSAVYNVNPSGDGESLTVRQTIMCWIQYKISLEYRQRV
jgi:hypothetical protein